MTRTSGKTLAMRGTGVVAAIGAVLGVAQVASALPAPSPADYQAVAVVQKRMSNDGWSCSSKAVEGPRAIMRTADRVHVVDNQRVRPLMRSGSQLLYWCHVRRPELSAWEPGQVDPLGTIGNPMFVHDAPSTNDGGGSWAWADYGLYQILRATKPSPAAKAICQLDTVGDSIWIEGGMMHPGQWTLIVAPPPWQRAPGDVDVMVNDPDGTHGGDCTAGGVVLHYVG